MRPSNPRLAPPTRTGLAWLPVLVAVLLSGCGPSAEEALAGARASLDAGDADASQTAFRRGLERNPDDLALLLFAAEFYLDGGRAEHHKPRLALHYAARASRAAGAGTAGGAAVHVRALRAMDQHDDARALLDEALAAHPGDPTLAALRDP